MRWAVLAAIVGCAGCAEERYPLPNLPGSCKADQRACYTHPLDGREVLLRCNDGSAEGAVWIVDKVCLEGELCEQGACAPVG